MLLLEVAMMVGNNKSFGLLCPLGLFGVRLCGGSVFLHCFFAPLLQRTRKNRKTNNASASAEQQARIKDAIEQRESFWKAIEGGWINIGKHVNFPK
jgi:hypothetical protein